MEKPKTAKKTASVKQTSSVATKVKPDPPTQAPVIAASILARPPIPPGRERFKVSKGIGVELQNGSGNNRKSIKQIKGWQGTDPAANNRRYRDFALANNRNIRILTGLTKTDLEKLKSLFDADPDAVKISLKHEGGNSGYVWEIKALNVPNSGNVLEIGARLYWPVETKPPSGPRAKNKALDPTSPFYGDLEISLTWPYEDIPSPNPPPPMIDPTNVQSIFISYIEVIQNLDPSP